MYHFNKMSLYTYVVIPAWISWLELSMVCNASKLKCPKIEAAFQIDEGAIGGIIDQLGGSQS